MFDFAVAVIALSSASIFLAHAVDAYLTPLENGSSKLSPGNEASRL